MKLYCLFITLTILFFSCENTSYNLSPSYKPYKVINVKDGNIDTLFVTYDGDEVKCIKTAEWSTTYERSSSHYKISSYKKNDSIPSTYSIYIFNSNQQVEKIEYYTNQNYSQGALIGAPIDSFNKAPYFQTFEYLHDGTIKTQFLYNENDKDRSDYTIISYDEIGNISKETSYDYFADNYVLRSVDSFVYDNKKHPMREVNYPLAYLNETHINNIIEIHSEKYSYSYDINTGTTLDSKFENQVYLTIEYNDSDFPTYIDFGDYSQSYFY